MKKEEAIMFTPQTQRVLKLLFKFRFITALGLANVMGIRRYSVYEVLDKLVKSGHVIKVYDIAWKIDRKPAYYYLSKEGVTAVRQIMGVKESKVNSLYRNDTASQSLIQQSLTTLKCYTPIKQSLPQEAEVFTIPELNGYKQFPKKRPDLYISTPDGQEAMVFILADAAPFVVRKRLDEILTHFEDEGWDGDYPRVAFILKDNSAKSSFLFYEASRLEEMGLDEDEFVLMAASQDDILNDQPNPWASVYRPKRTMALF
ncbi:winged helix-turn-helix transcriptional regulator [Candidatus Saccharibacteria bacterium]|nr:winged helix-turn-helix transcriptional regulator [Candidatus Saccharibacteria bacterium]